MSLPTIWVAMAVCFVSSTVMAVSLEKPYYELNDAENLFRDFVKQHGKKYDRKEYSERLEFFKETLKDINWRNEMFPNTVFAVNHFADLRPEELQQYLGFRPLNGTVKKVSILKSDEPVTAPDAHDWRQHGKVSHVKDLGQCGSSFIFSAIGNIEGQYAMKHEQCLALSEGQAHECGQDGDPHEVMNDLAKRCPDEKAGIMTEADYPYDDSEPPCQENCGKAVVKVLKGERIDVPSEDTLKQKLYDIGPLSVGLNAVDLLHYKSGILEPNRCKGKEPNYAVLLVGYGEENGTPFWIIKNAWGEKFGEQGYVRLRRRVNACVMGTSYTATAIVA
ncbi:procathepsin L-like [Cydia strobilella]|uniref:procathepsin L-like n=1 Tax=Cydia strobilella TaxID=1100964 RepID=UPI0030052931